MKKLHGSDPLYRIRFGDYCILYEVHDHRLHILIVEVGNRREVYRSSR